MRKSRVCDAHLVAAAHVERVDAREVRKGRIRDALLIAAIHVERVDAREIRKVRVQRGSRHAKDRAAA